MMLTPQHSLIIPASQSRYTSSSDSRTIAFINYDPRLLQAEPAQHFPLFRTLPGANGAKRPCCLRKLEEHAKASPSADGAQRSEQIFKILKNGSRTSCSDSRKQCRGRSSPFE